MSLKTRIFLTFSAVSLATCLSGPAKAQTQPNSTPTSSAPALTASSSASAQSLIDKAKQRFKQGETLFREGKTEEARALFDQAVDMLLSAPADVRNHADVQTYYFDLINKVHLLEVGALQSDDDTQETATPSPLDELATIDINKENVEDKTKQIDTDKFGFKFTVTSEVYKFISFYTNGRGRSTMEHGLARSGRYRAMAERIFAEEGVPTDLIWLAQVESVWQPSALSWAKAKGIWQFIPGTGQRFGLQQNGWVDERVAPEKATRAAAQYLKFLNNYFAGDWLLAMAAYNSGEGNVERAIARCGYADFWELHSRNLLPNETRNYVPAILAVIAVAKDQKNYGFNVRPEPAWKFDPVSIDDQIDLTVAANLLNVSEESLKTLNPELKRGVTPPGRYTLKVPAGTKQQFEVAYAALPADQRMRRTPVFDGPDTDTDGGLELASVRPVPAKSSYRTVMVSHKVRRGETLAGVASRYGVSIQEVAQHNRMSSKAELRNGQVIKVPVEKNEGSKYSVRSTKNSKHIAKSTPKGKASKGAKSSARRRR